MYIYFFCFVLSTIITANTPSRYNNDSWLFKLYKCQRLERRIKRNIIKFSWEKNTRPYSATNALFLQSLLSVWPQINNVRSSELIIFVISVNFMRISDEWREKSNILAHIGNLLVGKSCSYKVHAGKYFRIIHTLRYRWRHIYNRFIKNSVFIVCNWNWLRCPVVRNRFVMLKIQ